MIQKPKKKNEKDAKDELGENSQELVNKEGKVPDINEVLAGIDKSIKVAKNIKVEEKRNGKDVNIWTSCDC